jgi:NAD(P)-dependent dehydrogenase (short-subunit alcohol dehydrogenase family)
VLILKYIEPHLLVYFFKVQQDLTLPQATMSHPGRLESKVAIITGGGLGLGEGIARKFVFEGAKVVIFEINKENGTKVAESLGKGNATAIQGDVTKLDDWNKAVKTAIDTFGGLDIVVNNAGVVHNAQPSFDVPESEYERIMNINVRPLYQSAKAVHPHFKKQGRGVFVNLSSISAPRPRPNLVWYAGSKGAVSAVTKGLAAEFAKDGIRCNAICPVAADTGMMASVLGGTDSQEGRAVVIKGIPMGRVAEPKDVANAAAFLASDEAGFITGIELPVDGGRALQ